MEPIIEQLYNDNSNYLKIINELSGYLITKYEEEPSFTLACFKSGLNREQVDELFMLYSSLTNEIDAKDSEKINRKLLIEKTKEKFSNLTDESNIEKIVESYINCYFLLKDE